MFLGDAYYFGPGVLQLDLAWDQRDQGTEDQDDAAGPDPTDQRKYVRLDDGLVILQLREVQVQVLIHAAADGYSSYRLAAGFVELAHRLEGAEEFSVLSDIDGGALPRVVL